VCHRATRAPRARIALWPEDGAVAVINFGVCSPDGQIVELDESIGLDARMLLPRAKVFQTSAVDGGVADQCIQGPGVIEIPKESLPQPVVVPHASVLNAIPFVERTNRWSIRHWIHIFRNRRRLRTEYSAQLPKE